MNILITGGLGYIGTHTIYELLEHNHNLIIIDRENKFNQSFKNTKIYLGSIEDEKIIDQIFNENKIDAILHLAGYKYVAESVDEPEKYYKNNVDNMMLFMKHISKYDCRNIVFASSYTVYGSQNKLLEETDKLHPLSPYADTKVKGEEMLKDFSNKGFNVIVLRYANLIGNKYDYQFIDRKYPPITNFIINKAINKEKLNIYNTNNTTKDNSCLRDFVYIQDIAKANRLALENIEKYKYEVFNVGSGISTSIKELINYISTSLDIPIDYTQFPAREGEVFSVCARIDKIIKSLNYRPNTNISSIIDDITKKDKQN